jgi:uncharacterized protein (TIGR02646 family)
MITIKNYFDDFDEPVKFLSEEITQKRSKITQNKKKPNNPDGLSVLERIMKTPHTHVADATIYGASEVKKALLGIFNYKCAYCERKPGFSEVEHFRPKAKYYWLCYEWTNFLISCRACNGAGNKGNKFPLEDESKRIKSHSTLPNGAFDKDACHILSETLTGEKPYLLHPAIDKPHEHLAFLKNGSVEPVTEKGRLSIEIYGLNRSELIKDRENIILDIQKRILRKYIISPEPTEKEIKDVIRENLLELMDHIETERAFTGFKAAILNDFDAFIIDNDSILKFALPNQAIMKEAVKEFFAK